MTAKKKGERIGQNSELYLSQNWTRIKTWKEIVRRGGWDAPGGPQRLREKGWGFGKENHRGRFAVSEKKEGGEETARIPPKNI